MSSTIWRYLELKFRKFGERIDQNNPFSIDCELKENPKPISVRASSTAQQQICVCLLFALKGENLSYRPKTDSAPASAPARQYSLFSYSGLPSSEYCAAIQQHLCQRGFSRTSGLGPPVSIDSLGLKVLKLLSRNYFQMKRSQDECVSFVFGRISFPDLLTFS